MGVLDRACRLFGTAGGDDSYESMVLLLHMLVVSSHERFIAQHPRLAEAPQEHYEFVLTCASVAAALIGIEATNPETLGSVMQTIRTPLQKRFGKKALKAVLDCGDFVVERFIAVVDPGDVNDVTGAMAAGLGMWAVWNLFGEEPTDSDRDLMRLLGGFTFKAGSNSWS